MSFTVYHFRSGTSSASVHDGFRTRGVARRYA